MNTTRFKLMILTMCGIALAASAQQDIVTNRLSFSARVGFNISARFENNAAFGPGGFVPTRRTPPREGVPEGDLYNYDDGYVLTDFSENYEGMSWYVGYDDVNSQISGNTLLLSRTTPRAGGGATSRELDDDPLLGGELTYNRLLFTHGDARYGLETAVNYLNASFRANVPFAGTMQVVDAFNYVPGTTPPDTASGPYQGSFQGPGFTIFTNIASSTTNIIAGTDRQRFEADLWGLRVGPYLEVPMGDPMTLSLSAGLAMGLLRADASWRTTSGGTTISGSGHDSEVLWGAYVSGALTWYLAEHWSAIIGAQFQTLGDYEHEFGGREVEVDFGNSWFLTFGVSYTF